MQFRLINESKSMRHVWSRGRQVPISPGQTRDMDLSDANAVFIRRCEKRGDKFKIEAPTDEAREILLKAESPLTKPKRFNIIGPDGKPAPIHDEIEEVRLQNLVKPEAAPEVTKDVAMQDPPVAADVKEEKAEEPSKPVTRVRRQKA